jgi:hypothetical protein
MHEPALYLHIGYRKTGTTYLQKHVFPNMSNVLFLCKAAKPASKAIIEAFGRSPGIWKKTGAEIFGALEAETTTSFGTARSALVSSESMSMHTIFASHKEQKADPYLLAAHLHECQLIGKARGIRVKIFMGIRRQDQYLASIFSGIGKRVGEISQANFENQTAEILDFDRRYFIDGVWLDYKSVRDILVEAVGDDNLLILPQELLANEEQSFLSRLGAFIGEPGIKSSLSATKENVRGLGADVWQLRESLPRILTRKLVTRIGFKSAQLAMSGTLQLTDDLKTNILNRYKNGNARLASDLGINLGQFGYF